MPGEVWVSPRARDDVIEQAFHIAQDEPRAADRFLDAVEDAFNMLAVSPLIGTACQFPTPKLSGIRMWPVKGFDKHLAFYRPTETGIEVIRVLHAARDIPAILEQEAD